VPMCIKFLHPHALLSYTDDNMPIYRYAEALLFMAEAINEQGSRIAEAQGYLNQVRKRAGLANTTAANQADL
ncbi:RagB/SusD family nutrient uptake outer membrane protein, partial [Enterobacter asburiae]|uniref:RagB/SusD family nutrient uptake outer membrane protein n=1 Tax=Enterobacter asburiae TaxID=61645 RepID=UPI0022F10454